MNDNNEVLIVAEHNEISDRFRLIIAVKPLTDAAKTDLVGTIKNAVRDYAGTPDGKDTIKMNAGAFNWGDLVTSLPDAVCQAHGFQIMSAFVTETIVDHNELLNVNPDGEVIE